MPDTSEKRRTPEMRKWVFSAYDWMSTLIVSLLVLVVLFSFFFRVIRVEGTSMDATLHNGDQLLLSAVTSEYHRGDIVVVDRYTVDPLIKRIVAVGGDTIEIDVDGFVYLNGTLLSEPYASAFTPQKGCVDTVIVPHGYVFLMGDNRAVSLDSRSDEIGLVLEKDIVGKAVLRLSPFESFGGIYDNLEHSAMN